jgi:hypothetical protein
MASAFQVANPAHKITVVMTRAIASLCIEPSPWKRIPRMSDLILAVSSQSNRYSAPISMKETFVFTG